MRGKAVVGVNLTTRCLNLREKPNIKSNKIACLQSNSWRDDSYIKIDIKSDANKWFFVIVRKYQYKDENDSCGTLIETKRGWLKALDDNGFPNIWFSVTAY